ncbi:imidazolonepropionase [Mesorhizobium xinjiangense]|uniref:imidazolonepropionase n=1 Tax=Mesorhizobium xinjiangense TaxID=2678685 RepID=UPI0012EE1058|nr:imidazolonepropionase [Mesorhizobium xinjiangense]
MPRNILSGLRIATMDKGDTAYGLVERGSIGLEDDRIVWVTAGNAVPSDWRGVEIEDFGGRLATPALIDCHTHLVFGGNRAKEFEMRLEGASYEEVARAGGGIVSTVAATRAMGEDALVEDALPRLDALIGEGVATVEIKSGYGLTAEDELKMLRAARRLETMRPVRVKTSYLAAHAVPPEYKGRADAYIDEIVLPGMEAASDLGLVDAVDGFCEGIAFSPEQMNRVFARARALGLPVKLHAEQLSDLGGAKLAASYGALSADHLEYLDEDGVAAMAEAGTVAVLLPGAFYTLRETQLPPVAALRRAGVPIAVATDCNPGSSPLASLLLTLNMACTLFRLTPEEALAGATREAARALGLQDETGTLEPGKRADIAIWDVEHPAELTYRIGFNPLHRRIVGEDA